MPYSPSCQDISLMGNAVLNAKQRILSHLLIYGPTTLYELREPHIGGCSADVRLRELRLYHGFDIRWWFKEDTEGNKSYTTIYACKTPRERVDLENLKVLPAEPKQAELFGVYG